MSAILLVVIQTLRVYLAGVQFQFHHKLIHRKWEPSFHVLWSREKTGNAHSAQCFRRKDHSLLLLWIELQGQNLNPACLRAFAHVIPSTWPAFSQLSPMMMFAFLSEGRSCIYSSRQLSCLSPPLTQVLHGSLCFFGIAVTELTAISCLISIFPLNCEFPRSKDLIYPLRYYGLIV